LVSGRSLGVDKVQDSDLSISISRRQEQLSPDIDWQEIICSKPNVLLVNKEKSKKTDPKKKEGMKNLKLRIRFNFFN